MANEYYTFADLKNAVIHALHGTPNSKSPASQIVNRALTILTKMRPWRWRTKNVSINVTQTAITSISRTSIVVTVNQTAHGYMNGSAVAVVGADTAFNGQFVVTSVAAPVAPSTTSDSFSYNQLGSDATAATPGFTIPGFLLLPTDFEALLTLKAAINSFRDVIPTSLDDLWFRRQYSYGAAYETWFALNWQSQLSATVAPRAVLEIHPIPQAAAVGAFVGSYFRIIPALSADTDVPDLPSPYHGLLMVLCRALAVSTEEDRSGSDWELFGRMVADMAADDGASQGMPTARMCNTINHGYRPGPFFPAGRISA
jgi:hypothetical protein